ncbi:hypothetical protein [Leifsonia sp. NCR5]|uniref:GAP1-N2 domain-containing protein n=1 Tax=Leifsonia sp. NCR5 TaxID=1978342 RepID=UPI00117B7860|nr:hypothetical protein [Leifsonia sp. NCR5]
MLDILVYSDSAEGEALHGGTGFQFIAHSPGATLRDETVARGAAIQHVVPRQLAAADWAQHPPTCAYVRDGDRLYLSRGYSSGDTIGGRPGNQLTVTVMTSDPYDILPLRPAQLYSSPSWDLGRPSAQDLDPWQTPVEVSEAFDVVGLHTLITDDEWARDALPMILTMLEQTQASPRVKLLIRHTDQAVVMRWVALLSRFLDAESALRLGFRVFSDEPLAQDAHIVGAHPALSPELTVESAEASGVNLLDLLDRRFTAISPSPSAVRHARWFLLGDPYESLDAIEVSRRWSQHLDADTAARGAELAAMATTRAAVGVDELHTALDVIFALAVAGELDELEAYGDELADIVAGCAPTDASDLLRIDAALSAAHNAGDAGLAQSLALCVLEWAAARPEDAREWARQEPRVDGRIQWDDAEARAHAGRLLAGVLAVADPDLLPAYFVRAGYLDTSLSAADVSLPIDRLAAQWAARPGLGADARRWALSDTVTERLVNELGRRLDRGDPAAIAALVAGSWDWLAPSPWRPDDPAPLAPWFAVRELRGASTDRRAEVLAQVQGSVPGAGWRAFLPTADGLHPMEVAHWVKVHRALDPQLAVEIERILASVDRHTEWRRTGAANVLHQIDRLGDATPAALRSAAAAQRRIMPLFEQSVERRSTVPNPALAALNREFAGSLAPIYGDWILRSILVCDDLQGALRLAGREPETLMTEFREVLVADLRRGDTTALASAARLLDPSAGRWSDVAKSALDAVWDDRRTEATRQQLLADAERTLAPDEQVRLDAYLADQGRGRVSRGVLRGARSLFGGKGTDR